MPDFARDAEKSRFAKSTLREQLLTRRRHLSAAERTSAAVAVQTATTDWVRTQHPSTAAAYVPVGSEPGGADLPEALAAALPPGSRLLLPVLMPDNDLDWVVYQGPQSLAPGPRGLREPVGPHLGVEAIRHAEVIIVPALAVDRTGVRMGRGGGSYDRVLARITTGRTVALLHDGELLDVVPAESHDRTVGAVITPSEGLALFPGTGWPQPEA